MSEVTTKNDSEIQLTRWGKTLYESNPSIAGNFPIKMKAKHSKNVGNAYMVAPGTGEVLGKASFNFVEEIEVDEAQFVKVYLDGIKQHGQLGKAGVMLFEFVYRELSGAKAKDNDKITLNYFLAAKWKPELNKRTYERGMSELLEKGFLFRSVVADVYFVNIRFMFNGNRQNIIKSYRIKGTKPMIAAQMSLFDNEAIEHEQEQKSPDGQ
jgi:hypothetical protein